MKLSRHQLGVIAIILNTTVWSVASPILKWTMTDIQPFSLAFYRFIIATLIMLPFVIHKLKVRIDDFYKLLVLSFVGITLNITFYYLGLSLAPSINLPIISSMTPILLIVGAMIFLKEKPKRKTVYGTLVSLVGFLIIIVRPLVEHGATGSILGNFYYLLSTVTIVLYTILLKKYKLNYSYTVIMFWLFFLGLLAFFPMFLLENQGTNPLTHFNLKATIGILYGGVLSSIVGYFLYNYAVKNIKAQEIGIFSYMDPFLTAIVAIPLLGETITASYLVGSLFVFLGIYIAERRIPYHPIHKLKSSAEEV